MKDNCEYYIMYMAWELPTEYWDEPEDEEGDDEWVNAYDEFLKDNDLPMTIGVKVPYGQFDRVEELKYDLSEHYGYMAKSYDYSKFDSEEKWLRRLKHDEAADRYPQTILEWTPSGFKEYDAGLVNESDNDIKKLLKLNGVTKLPSGTEFKSDRVSWVKRGGYAGQKTLDRVCSQLEDAGWKRGEWRTGGVPDGSAVTNSNAYTSPDGQLVMTYSEHFGATAHDNFYGFTFKLTGNNVNEGADHSTITGTGRVDFDDDLVAVYTPDGKVDYKGLFDDCPYKYDDMRYDKSTMTYRIEGSNGDYRILAKLDESSKDETSRFGFKVGDRVVLTKDKSNRFSGDFICAGTEGEIVAVDKPMPGVMKVKIEDWKTISVPERNLKLVGKARLSKMER